MSRLGVKLVPANRLFPEQLSEALEGRLSADGGLGSCLVRLEGDFEDVMKPSRTTVNSTI